jgi:uncharacterized membrane protein YvlD (DUF360 family)
MVTLFSPAAVILFGAFVAVIGALGHLMLRFYEETDPAARRKHEIAAHAAVLAAAVVTLVGVVLTIDLPRSAPFEPPSRYPVPSDDVARLAEGC